MASEIFYIAAGADDGQCLIEGTGFSGSGNFITLGKVASGGYRLYLRFANVTIPAGSFIQSAFIRLTAGFLGSNVICNVNIQAQDEINPNAPTSGAQVIGASLGTEVVNWNAIGSWADGGQYNSPDIADVIQEIINKGYWDSGDALIVHVIDNASSEDANRYVSAYEYLSAAERAELHIQWTDIGFSATVVAQSITAAIDFFVPVQFIASMVAGSSTSAIELIGVTFDESIIDQAGLDDTIGAIGGAQDVEPPADQVGLNDTISALGPVLASLSDQAGLNDSVVPGGIWGAPISDRAGIDDWINGGLETNHALTDQVGIDDSIECLNWSEFLRENQFNYVIRYFCTLTGAANDTSDIEIPIQQFQARKRDGESTYLSVNIPSFDYAGQIADRANGQIIVEMAYFVNNIEQLREEILRVDLENIRTDQGSTNRSITLTGHLAESYGNQIATLTDPIYKYVSGGIRRFRFAIPDPYVNPGDTIRVGEDEFRAGFITYTVSSRYRSMEITEVG